MQDRLIRIPEVINMIALSRASIYRLIKEKKFPEPVRQGRTSAWLYSEVRAYLDSIKAQREAPSSSR